MSLQAWVAVLLGFGALLAALRFALHARRFALPWPKWLLVLLLQPVAAALLYLALFPPPDAQRTDRLVIASAATTAAQIARHGNDATLLALPEAPALPGALRVPDLATALRRHPQVSQLLVLGQGLPARDRDAARGHALQFIAAPLPTGLIELQSPTRATVGQRWQASGAVNALPGGSIELIDPAGRRADRSRLSANGRFALHGSALAPGRARYSLRLRDAQGKVVEQLPVWLQVEAGSPMRVLVLAGGPSPELKYLRRWAVDAGLTLRTQISVGAGLRIGDPPVSIDPATLRDYDLLLLDERAWRELDSARKTAVGDALRNGLGILLRVTGPLSAAERRELREFGFSVEPANVPQSITLPPAWLDPAPTENSEGSSARALPSDDAIAAKADQDSSIVLTRQPLRVTANDGVVLLGDDTGAPLALWRSESQGRIALWWLGDSYRLSLAGQAAAHGRLWSQAFATVARARGSARPALRSNDPRPHQRLVICGLSDDSVVRAPDGSRIDLLVDPASRCAAYWPSRAGWHTVQDKDAQLAFAVRANDEAPGLRAHEYAEATRQLISTSAPSGAQAQALQPGARWPWFLGWLLLSAGLWWVERRLLR
jgi:hypothetical protein